MARVPFMCSQLTFRLVNFGAAGATVRGLTRVTPNMGQEATLGLLWDITHCTAVVHLPMLFHVDIEILDFGQNFWAFVACNWIWQYGATV